jgi:hypothetical protein
VRFVRQNKQLTQLRPDRSTLHLGLFSCSLACIFSSLPPYSTEAHDLRERIPHKLRRLWSGAFSKLETHKLWRSDTLNRIISVQRLRPRSLAYVIPDISEGVACKKKPMWQQSLALPTEIRHRKVRLQGFGLSRFYFPRTSLSSSVPIRKGDSILSLQHTEAA